jgi:hypothetical protein
MPVAAVDLLPRDAELARRAAGGDGAAFVRLYDKYSTEVFTTSLAATGSIEAASEATQTAFLRVLRWPPPLGAPDSDVAELLCALALGGPDEHAAATADTPEAQAIARMVGVGWLRSETVAEAGARFDADWSVYLWSPPPGTEPFLAPRPSAIKPLVAWCKKGLRPRRLRLSPGFAVTAAVTAVLFTGAAGTILASGEGDPNETAPAVRDGGQADRSQRAELRRDDKRRPKRPEQTKLLRDEALKPLLAP